MTAVHMSISTFQQPYQLCLRTPTSYFSCFMPLQIVHQEIQQKTRYDPDFEPLLWFLGNCVINLIVSVFLWKIVFLTSVITKTQIVKAFCREICHQKALYYSLALSVFEIFLKNFRPVTFLTRSLKLQTYCLSQMTITVTITGALCCHYLDIFSA